MNKFEAFFLSVLWFAFFALIAILAYLQHLDKAKP